MSHDFDLLKKICEIPGVCGFEDPVQALVTEELQTCCDEVWHDLMGNVFGLKKGSGSSSAPKVMFAGHADEIGMMVTHIDSDGFVRFQQVGGLSSPYLISQRVIIHGKEKVHGVIPTKYGELTSDAEKDRIQPISDLYIDTGLSYSEISAKVTIGDVISVDQDFTFLNDKVVTGRNFDDRLGVYNMIRAMKTIEGNTADVYGVATVQEELGVRGAHTAAYTVDPDFGIAIDGSITQDVPHAAPHQKHCALGGGTGIYIMDRLTLGSPKLIKFLVGLCEDNQIPFQRNIGGGTDASAIQRSRSGALSTTIGAPTRYMHSSVQLAHVDDIDATTLLLKAFAENAEKLSELLE